VRRKGLTAPGGSQEGAAKIGVTVEASSISRLTGVAKLQPATGADNPRYAAGSWSLVAAPWHDGILTE